MLFYFFFRLLFASPSSLPCIYVCACICTSFDFYLKLNIHTHKHTPHVKAYKINLHMIHICRWQRAIGLPSKVVNKAHSVYIISYVGRVCFSFRCVNFTHSVRGRINPSIIVRTLCVHVRLPQYTVVSVLPVPTRHSTKTHNIHIL